MPRLDLQENVHILLQMNMSRSKTVSSSSNSNSIAAIESFKGFLPDMDD